VNGYDLDRFLEAQEGVYEGALRELRAGRKVSHWMWFVFPQFDGLGMSGMSRRYAIRSLDEARAYLRHPVLGGRLTECTEAVNELDGLTARQIFGTPDDRKFRSSMTLFELVSGPDSPFASALDKYFSTERDARTIELVRLATEVSLGHLPDQTRQVVQGVLHPLRPRISGVDPDAVAEPAAGGEGGPRRDAETP
jgi:uncharacterized protein (DUF1810 family)